MNRNRQALKAFFITLLLGPPVGGMLFLVPMLIGVVSDANAGPLLDVLHAAASFTLLVLAFAYILGGLSALLAGLLIAWQVRKWGGASLRFVLLAAVLGGLSGSLLVYMLTAGDNVEPTLAELGGRALTNIALSLVAALVLLPLLRRAGIPARADGDTKQDAVNHKL